MSLHVRRRTLPHFGGELTFGVGLVEVEVFGSLDCVDSLGVAGGLSLLGGELDVEHLRDFFESVVFEIGLVLGLGGVGVVVDGGDEDVFVDWNLGKLSPIAGEIGVEEEKDDDGNQSIAEVIFIPLPEGRLGP